MYISYKVILCCEVIYSVVNYIGLNRVILNDLEEIVY